MITIGLCLLNTVLPALEPLHAQIYPVITYTPREGLVNSRVNRIVQDSKGRMYFLTYGGLSVYDGARFLNYRTTEGLTSPIVNDVLEITPDSFLIATNGAHLNTLVNGRIDTFLTKDGYYPVVNRFLKSSDGRLYMTADHGLFVLEKDEFRRLSLVSAQGEDLGNALDKIVEYQHLFLIIPWSSESNNTLLVYDRSANRLSASIGGFSISDVTITPDRQIWLHTSQGLLVPDTSALIQGEIILSKMEPFLKPDLWNRWQSATTAFDHSGNVWFCHANQVAQYTSTREFFPFPLNETFRTSGFSDLFIDREDNIWLASNGGVMKLTGAHMHFLEELIPGLKNNFSAMLNVRDTIWLYHLRDRAFYRVHEQDVVRFPYSLPAEGVVHNFLVSGKSLLIADGRYIHLVTDKNDMAAYTHTEKIEAGPEGYAVGHGLTDSNEVALFYGGGNALHEIIAISGDRIIDKHAFAQHVDQFTLDREGNLWTMRRDDYLYRFTTSSESSEGYLQVSLGHSTKEKNYTPRSLAIDRDGDVWIGTRFGGVHHLTFEKDSVISATQINASDGLSDDFVERLYCAPDNAIWTMSPTSIDRIVHENGTYRVENITRNRGLFDGARQITTIGDGVIWALMNSGEILQIEKAESRAEPVFPELYISAIYVNSSKVGLDKHRFTYLENNLSVSVATPSFIDEKSIRYSYLLEGSGNDQWSTPSNTADFNFINLAPGAYILHLKAEFPAKKYPDQEISYVFVISAPFWRTWWFMAVVILGALSTILLLLRFYYSRKLERQRIIMERKQAIERERTRIASDMHDDLGAGLSRIKFLSETIGMKQQMQMPVNEEVHHIREHTHEMIDKMGEIVWALNEKNDSLNDLLAFTRTYAITYLTENGIRPNIDKLPQFTPVIVSGEYRRNVFLAVKEALHNIVKHARAESVIMHFTVNGKLKIAIYDDGKGFDLLNETSGNGIQNMRRRMTEIGGAFDIRVSNGTEIHLTAPL